MEKEYDTSTIEVVELGTAGIETQGLGLGNIDQPAGQPNTGILDD